VSSIAEEFENKGDESKKRAGDVAGMWGLEIGSGPEIGVHGKG